MSFLISEGASEELSRAEKLRSDYETKKAQMMRPIQDLDRKISQLQIAIGKIKERVAREQQLTGKNKTSTTAPENQPQTQPTSST